ncbi:hypothetical protein RKD35_002826 [Streptomyces albogriseolus]
MWDGSSAVLAAGPDDRHTYITGLVDLVPDCGALDPAGSTVLNMGVRIHNDGAGAGCGLWGRFTIWVNGVDVVGAPASGLGALSSGTGIAPGATVNPTRTATVSNADLLAGNVYVELNVQVGADSTFDGNGCTPNDPGVGQAYTVDQFTLTAEPVPVTGCLVPAGEPTPFLRHICRTCTGTATVTDTTLDGVTAYDTSAVTVTACGPTSGTATGRQVIERCGCDQTASGIVRYVELWSVDTSTPDDEPVLLGTWLDGDFTQPYEPVSPVDCPADPGCASPTTPVTSVGLCLADGTPIAVTVVRDCDGTITSEGWLNLTTGAWTAGAVPVGTVACGDSRSIQVSGTFCAVDDTTGDVVGLVLVEYTYDDTGAIADVRLVDAVTGTTYTPPAGVTVTVCPTGTAQPEQDAVVLCHTATDGTVTQFVRDYRRDETGAITAHSDYLLDGTAYTPDPSGAVGVCAPCCPDHEVVCYRTPTAFGDCGNVQIAAVPQAKFTSAEVVANPQNWPISAPGLASTYNGELPGSGGPSAPTGVVDCNTFQGNTGVAIDYRLAEPRDNVTAVRLWNSFGGVVTDNDGIGSATVTLYDADDNVLFTGPLVTCTYASNADYANPCVTPVGNLDGVARMRIADLAKFPPSVGTLAPDIGWREIGLFSTYEAKLTVDCGGVPVSALIEGDQPGITYADGELTQVNGPHTLTFTLPGGGAGRIVTDTPAAFSALDFTDGTVITVTGNGTVSFAVEVASGASVKAGYVTWDPVTGEPEVRDANTGEVITDAEVVPCTTSADTPGTEPQTCQDCETLLLCADDPATITGLNVSSGTLPNGVDWQVKASTTAAPSSANNADGAWWGDVETFPNVAVSPYTFTFSRPSVVEFSVYMGQISPPPEPDDNTMQLPPGLEVVSLPAGFVYDAATGQVRVNTSQPADPNGANLANPTRAVSARFRTPGPVSSLRTYYYGPRRAIGGAFRTAWVGALEVTPSTQFLRRICRDCDGAVTGITDTLLDGTTLYTPPGEVAVCEPVQLQQAGVDVEQLTLCHTAADGTVTPFIRRYSFDASTGLVTSVLDYQLGGTAFFTPAPGGTIGVCSSSAEPCHNTTTVLLCAAPADGTTEVTPAITDSTVAAIGQTQFQNHPGPYTPLWTGGTLVYPAGPGPAQQHLAATGQLTADVTGCEDAAGTLTVSVRVRNDGPDDGQAWDGALRLFRGTTQIAAHNALEWAPVGWQGTLTVSAPVTAAEVAAGDIRVSVQLETYHLGAKQWTADQFTASLELEGCALTAPVQILRNVVTDCETGEVVTTYDTTLDGEPYDVGTGEVSQCQPVTQPQEPSCCPSSETVHLCHTSADGTVVTEFVRDYHRDATGIITGYSDYTLDGADFVADPTGTVGQCRPVDCTSTPLCVRPSGVVEFISNAENRTTGAVDGVWEWSSMSLAGPWYDMYQVGVFPGWTVTDPGTPGGTAHWVSQHPNSSTVSTGLANEGPDLTAANPDWYARASFELPSFADPATIQVTSTVLNADQMAVEWRLNAGPWQPVGADHNDAAYTFGPAAVPGAQAGTNTIYLHGQETVFGSGATGVMMHLVVTYDVDASAFEQWLRTTCSDGSITYLDGDGNPQPGIPADYTIVPCPGGSGGDGFDVETWPLCILDSTGAVVQHVRAEQVYDTAGVATGAPRLVDAATGDPAAIPAGGSVTVCPSGDGASCVHCETVILADSAPLELEFTSTAVDATPYTGGAPNVAVDLATSQQAWDQVDTDFNPVAPVANGQRVFAAARIGFDGCPPCGAAGQVNVQVCADWHNNGPTDAPGGTARFKVFNGTTEIHSQAYPNPIVTGGAAVFCTLATVSLQDVIDGKITATVDLETADAAGAQRSWEVRSLRTIVTSEITGCGQQFARTTCRDCEGNVVSVTQTTLTDGETYEPVGDVSVPLPPNPCVSGGGAASGRQILERCGCSDEDGDGTAETRYVELWSVDPEGGGAPLLVGTYVDGDFDQPITPAAPMDCPAGDTAGGSAVNTAIRRLTGASVLDVTGLGVLQSVTVTVLAGAASVSTSDGTADLPAGASLTWSVATDSDSALDALTVTTDAADDVLVTATYKS